MRAKITVILVSILFSTLTTKSQTTDLQVTKFWKQTSLSFRLQTMPDFGRSLLFSLSSELYSTMSTTISKIETISTNPKLQDHILLSLYKKFGKGEFAKLLFANSFGCSQSMANYMINYIEKRYKNDKRIIEWEKKQKAITNKNIIEDSNKEEENFVKPTETKSENKESQREANLDTITTVTQVEAEFPGGRYAWSKYLQKITVNWREKYNNSENDIRLIISFRVFEDGSVNDIVIEGTSDENLKKEVKELYQSSPKWTPALQNNKPVIYKGRQILRIPGN